MSKKKSLAWNRKTTGHISTGVLNYANIVKSGQPKGRIDRQTWGKRNKIRDAARAEDAVRQSLESDIDFNIVRMGLDFGMSLGDAKDYARSVQESLTL